jgi:thiamine pyrophosphokinase
MMLIEDVKKGINNSLKEIQENSAKDVEALKVETQKSLKELQENTTKQVIELNKTNQDLKKEVETIKKTQSKKTLEIETLGKKSGTIDEHFLKNTSLFYTYPASIDWGIQLCQGTCLMKHSCLNLLTRMSVIHLHVSFLRRKRIQEMEERISGA